jgi:hypothetical protein
MEATLDGVQQAQPKGDLTALTNRYRERLAWAAVGSRGCAANTLAELHWGREKAHRTTFKKIVGEHDVSVSSDTGSEAHCCGRGSPIT